MKLLIKYPTRGRPELFRETIMNIHQTIGSENYTILVTTDNNDPITYESMLESFPNRDKIILKRGHSYSKIHAVNRDMDFAYHELEWEWCLVMSDDMKFIESNWYDRMISDIYSRWTDTDFYAHYNDGHTRHRLCTMEIFGKEYFERFFYIYPPCYGNIQCDGERMFVAMMLNKHHYFGDDRQYYEHRHPGNVLDVKIDSTYNLHTEKGYKDIVKYNYRKTKNFYVCNPINQPINPDGSWEGELR